MYVHETLYALTLHMLGLFLKIYNMTVSCIVEFTGHLLSDRDTTSSSRMGAGGNGNNHWEWEGMGMKKTNVPAVPHTSTMTAYKSLFWLN